MAKIIEIELTEDTHRWISRRCKEKGCSYKTYVQEVIWLHEQTVNRFIRPIEKGGE